MTIPIEILKERANKAAKRFADLFRTPGRIANWQKLGQKLGKSNLGRKRSEETKAKMSKAQHQRRTRERSSGS
jgi:hypothetical protein